MDESERANLEQMSELAAARSRAEAAEVQLGLVREEGARRLQTVGHELRTPLTVLKGYVRLLAGGEVGRLNEQQQEFLDQCERGCHVMDRFIENLVEPATHGNDTARLRTERLCLIDVTRELVELLCPIVESRRVSLSIVNEEAAAPIECDRTRIERLLINLLENAMQAVEPGGKVEIHFRSLSNAENGDSKRVEVSVCDDGPGIPRIETEKIFDRFFRGFSARNSTGLGLGLAICQDIVTMHGGEIEVGDSQFGGARFTFRIPQSCGSKPDIGTEI